MRTTFAALTLLAGSALLLASTAMSPTHADPYAWCADYSSSSDAGSSCYFVTLDQCRASVLGVGGFCRANGLYDGRPLGASGESPRRGRPRAAR